MHSGHADFSESTEEIAPLTEEERLQKLADLREKVKAKRANQAVVDKEEQKRNEVGFKLQYVIYTFILYMLTTCSKSVKRLQRSRKT